MDELGAHAVRQVDGLAGFHDPQIDHLLHPRFQQLAFDKADRQRRTPDRDFGRALAAVQLRYHVRQRADMVLVPVRQQDAPEVLDPLLDIGDIRDDQVDALLILFRELAAAVEQEDAVAALDGGHVLADLADAAERDHPDPVLADRTWH